MYNILDYGAVSDGITLNTGIIQAAIDDCAENGGGRVHVPAGTFVTGTIWLRSNVELHLEHGARLKASTNLDDYNVDDAYEQNWFSAVEEWNMKHLILAVECENVALTGSGIIDGSAGAFYAAPQPYDKYCWRDGLALSIDKERLRPGQLLCFIESKHIMVKDITIQNNTSWTCYVHGCEYVEIRGLKVYNPSTAANTDGIDIDCCRYVTVSDCIIMTGDDAIAIRSCPHMIKNKDMACEYVTVTNCVLSSASSVFRIGVGNGKINHVRVSNIVIKSGSTVLNIMASYGPSSTNIHDVNFSGISGTDICYPITIGGNRGSVTDITISDFRVEAIAQSVIAANSECTVSDITLRDVEITIVKDSRVLSPSDLELRGENVLSLINLKHLYTEGVSLITESSEQSDWQHIRFEENCEHTGVISHSFL